MLNLTPNLFLLSSLLVAISYVPLLRAESDQGALSRAPQAAVGVRWPPNDNFANRAVLVGSPIVITNASNKSATLETGEPSHAHFSGTNSVWWTWTALEAGTVIIDLSGSDFDTLLGVYTGDALNTLIRVASDDESGVGSASKVIFAANAGTAYQIAVAGYAGTTGNIKLSLRLVTAAFFPSNDNFANRTILGGSSIEVTNVSNVLATREAGEPSHAFLTGTNSVWWTWTAPESGIAIIDLSGSNFDTLLGVYIGDEINALKRVASDYQSGVGSASKVLFAANAGTAYQIAVDGHRGAVGDIRLSLRLIKGPVITSFGPESQSSKVRSTVWFAVGAVGQLPLKYQWLFNNVEIAGATNAMLTLSSVTTNHAGLYTVMVRDITGITYSVPATLAVPTPPSNDDFANQAVFTGSTVVITNASNEFASFELGEPNHNATGFSTGGSSVWWTWIAPESGTVIIDLSGSTFDTFLAAYTGDAVNALERMASDDDSGEAFTSQVAFYAEAGIPYRIAVDGRYGASGRISLSLRLVINPMIISQPQPQTVTAAGMVNFSTSAIGQRPLSYQWRLNETNLAGATNATLALTNVRTNQAGGYTVVVSNSVGASTSQVARLIVDCLPLITEHPTNQVARKGTAVSFSTGAIGCAPLNYQWLFNSVPLPGATNANLDLSSVTTDLSGTFQVTASNYAGVVTSKAAVLAVGPPPNDNFADRLKLEGETVVVTNGFNYFATRERAEPDHDRYLGGSSVWWTWTAPRAGTVVIDLSGSTFDTFLAVYVGNSMQSLTRVAQDDDSGEGPASKVAFSVTGGTTYQIAIDGYLGDSGFIKMNLRLISDSVVIVSQPRSLSVCGWQSARFSISVVGTGPFRYQLFLRRTPFDNAFGRTPIPGDIIADELSTDSSTAVLHFSTPFETSRYEYELYVKVSNNTGSATSEPFFLVIWLCAPPFPTLSRGFPRVFNDSTKKNSRPKITTQCGVLGTKSAWFPLRSQDSGFVSVSTEGSDFDTVLVVLAGQFYPPADLAVVACNDDISPDNKSSRLRFFYPGQMEDYWIVVDGKTNVGRIKLTYGFESDPRFDFNRLEPDGSFRIRRTVSAGEYYGLSLSLQVSVDLITWATLLKTNVLRSAVIDYRDTNAAHFTHRFYRIVPGQ